MPSHPDRVRTAELPEGYQFGDARKVSPAMYRGLKWRAPHENSAERLTDAHQRAFPHHSVGMRTDAQGRWHWFHETD
jgi:hypothetical protein